MKFRHLVRFTRSRYFKVDYDEYQSAERSHHILDRKEKSLRNILGKALQKCTEV